MIEVSKEKEDKNNYEKNMENSVETRNLYIIGDSYAHFTKDCFEKIKESFIGIYL